MHCFLFYCESKIMFHKHREAKTLLRNGLCERTHFYGLQMHMFIFSYISCENIPEKVATALLTL